MMTDAGSPRRTRLVGLALLIGAFVAGAIGGAAFERTLSVVEQAGLTKVHVFPYSPRPGTRTAASDTVPSPVKKERSARLRALSDGACRRAWEAKVGTEDVVLVDRPGRGYGDDYTPWLVHAPAGELVRAMAVGVGEEGVVGAPV